MRYVIARKVFYMLITVSFIVGIYAGFVFGLIFAYQTGVFS